jgi:hypothetical protein
MAITNGVMSAAMRLSEYGPVKYWMNQSGMGMQTITQGGA